MSYLAGTRFCEDFNHLTQLYGVLHGQSAGITSSANPASLLVFRCGNCLNRKLSVLFPRISRIFSKLIICSGFSNFFQFFDVLPLVFASPEDLCSSFFFFLNGSSFPSASILSGTCSSEYPLRYCLPEMSFPIELLAVWYIISKAFALRTTFLSFCCNSCM